PDAELHPCYVAIKNVLATYGIKVDAIKSLANVDDKTCVNPVPLIDGATWLLDASKLALNITIPQIYLNNAVNGYISPSRWDQAINAMMMNYDFSASHTIRSNYDDDDDSYYLNLRNGINLGAWRFRNYSTLNSY
ncbi:fimbrial biogenesis outer membrane usher protein, partial [Escherichia coli]|uniref:fimbrial biogenesis outer membrane usher protein n=1 Tax=Escherichia coli TaxID=562 RepID=UPI0012C874E2